MAKYPISKEFFPFNLFAPPMSRRFVLLAQRGMKPPKFLWKDPQLSVQTGRIPGYRGGGIEIFVLTPQGLCEPAPCLMHIHGGGFVFEGSGSHFRMAMTYAKEAQCKVVYVRYRLAPKHPFPVPQEDCYAALCWIYAHADELGVDRERIGIAGDSAGGTLTVTSCMMARDRQAAVRPLFQLLVFPWLDDRNTSASCRRFTDTPMWNSTLSKKVGPIINPDPSATPLAYRSVVEADSFGDLPPAYIEVAEFDCLHDDGVLYAQLLRNAGIEAEFHEVGGTMHGFDTVFNAPTTQKMIAERTAYMKRMFGRTAAGSSVPGAAQKKEKEDLSGPVENPVKNTETERMHMELNCRETERPFSGIYELDVRGGRVKLPRAFLGVGMECAEYVVCVQQGVCIMKVGGAGIAADMAGARPQAGTTIVESGAAQIDRYGRLLVPQSFACQAEQGKMTVAVVGLNSHIEIWEIGAYRAMEDAQEKDFDFLNALLEDGE